MGYLREKYTREYFTNRRESGEPTDYGALGADDWREGGIFGEIKEAIDLVPLEGKRVLEIGFGRGESARYMLREKGISSYFGLDFSDAAYELALETLRDIRPGDWHLELTDALPFLSGQEFDARFDVAYMLDAIEHIPRLEVAALLPILRKALVPGGFLVVDTPFYSVDEDLVAQKNVYKDPSPTDLHPKTVGMHCNKYTRTRLHREMSVAGFRVRGDRLFQRPHANIVRRFWESFRRMPRQAT